MNTNDEILWQKTLLEDTRRFNSNSGITREGEQMPQPHQKYTNDSVKIVIVFEKKPLIVQAVRPTAFGTPAGPQPPPKPEQPPYPHRGQGQVIKSYYW
jgi:hypothetical protein